MTVTPSDAIPVRGLPITSVRPLVALTPEQRIIAPCASPENSCKPVVQAKITPRYNPAPLRRRATMRKINRTPEGGLTGNRFHVITPPANSGDRAGDVTAQEADRDRLLSIVDALTSKLRTGASLKDIIDNATQMVHQALDVDASFYITVSPDQRFPTLLSNAGTPLLLESRQRLTSELDALVRRTLASSQPVVITDSRKEHGSDAPHVASDRRCISGVTVAVVARGNPVGVFGVQCSHPRLIQNSELQLLSSVAVLLGLAREEYSPENGVHDELTALLESATDGIIAHDMNGNVTFVNSAALQVIGCASARQLEGLRVESLLRMCDARDQQGELLQFRDLPAMRILDGQHVSEVIVSCQNSVDRIRRWVAIQARSVLNKQGQPQFVITMLRDITAQQRAEEAQRIVTRITAALNGDSLPGMLRNVEQMLAEHIRGICTFSLQDGPSPTSVSDGGWHRNQHVHLRPDSNARGFGDEPARELQRVRHIEHWPIAHLFSSSQTDHQIERTVHKSLGSFHVIAFPLQEHGNALGFLTCSRDRSQPSFSDDDVALLLDIADRVAFAISNARLRQSLEERQGLLEKAIEQLSAIGEMERRRVALSIHDGLAQVAASAYQHLEVFASHFPDAPSEQRTELVRAQELARRTIREARRLIADLRPMALDDFVLVSALQDEVADLEACGWEIHFEVAIGDLRIPKRIEEDFFRIAQEALANVRKHAGHTPIDVSLTHCGNRLRLAVRDYGAGFDPSAQIRRSDASDHVGVEGMKERLELIGGTVTIDSRLGEGTCVTAEVAI